MGRSISTNAYDYIGDHLMLYVLALLLCPLLVLAALLTGAPWEAGLYMWTFIVIIIFAVVHLKYWVWLLP